ncbi:cytochrome b [Ancylobacter polymorphus]|uniref:Cytochrome b/b6 domain-containing protein n=1 Tax=Ancylobacter polymorphus TaxID=223390 RepID=A0A9E6ZX93_9HYPH|nr:cytochrome b/b6 domain-containing protein [Ancylobacter polymorphus]UOK73409.1 cytochrome b/b6 domain-containing protein [Ancylobacter polymorphus]
MPDPIAPKPPRYRRPARRLHWIMAAIVITMVPLGIAVNYLPWDAFQDWLFNLHKSLGIVVLGLVVVRLGYRLTHKPPPLPASIPPSQRLLAESVHIVLYVILFAMPVIGWIGTNAYGEPMNVFWSVTLPAVTGKNEAVSDVLWTMHNVLGLTLGGLILVHAGAALAHRFVLKDGVLGRMWPP